MLCATYCEVLHLQSKYTKPEFLSPCLQILVLHTNNKSTDMHKQAGETESAMHLQNLTQYINIHVSLVMKCKRQV